MQLISTIVIWEFKSIGSGVTFGEVRVVSVLVVEGLVDVSNIVDQQAQSVRLCKLRLTGVQSVLDVVVDVRGFVTSSVSSVAQPLDEVRDSNSQIASFVRGVKVGNGTALIQVWSLLEVIVRLPGTSVILNVVGEC